MSKVNPFGKAVRNARMEIGVRLKDMADYLGVSSAYLSAVETGNKKVPEDLVQQVVRYVSDRGLDGSEILRAAARTQQEVTLDLRDTSPETREVVAAFARRFPAMTDEQVRDVFERAIEHID